MVANRDSYYSWAPLVDSLLDAYESQGDFQTVIEVEKANETRKHVKMVVPLLTMEELAEQVDHSRHMLGKWYERTVLISIIRIGSEWLVVANL